MRKQGCSPEWKASESRPASCIVLFCQSIRGVTVVVHVTRSDFLRIGEEHELESL